MLEFSYHLTCALINSNIACKIEHALTPKKIILDELAIKFFQNDIILSNEMQNIYTNKYNQTQKLQYFYEVLRDIKTNKINLHLNLDVTA
jgi:hypothetical protein